MHNVLDYARHETEIIWSSCSKYYSCCGCPVPVRFLLVFGDTARGIKLFPVIHALRAYPEVDTRVCVTRPGIAALLDQVWRSAGIVPDIDLDVMQDNQTLDGLTARLIVELGKDLRRRTTRPGDRPWRYADHHGPPAWPLITARSRSPIRGGAALG